MKLIAQARIAALQARADEALTLVARGSGDAFETDYKDRMATLAGDGNGGLLGQARDAAVDADVRADAAIAASTAVASWRKQHQQVRDARRRRPVPGGGHARRRRRRRQPRSTAIDTSLGDAIAQADGAFRDHAASADAAMSGAAIGWTLLTLISIAGMVLGLRQRIAEYR